MWPTRSRVSQPVHRVMTFQFLGSETRRVKFSRSRRMTLMTVSLPSADIGLTGAIVAVLLISSFPSQRRNCDHVPFSLHQCSAPVVAVVGTTIGGSVTSNWSRRTLNHGRRPNLEPSDPAAPAIVNPRPPSTIPTPPPPPSPHSTHLQS